MGVFNRGAGLPGARVVVLAPSCPFLKLGALEAPWLIGGKDIYVYMPRGTKMRARAQLGVSFLTLASVSLLIVFVFWEIPYPVWHNQRIAAATNAACFDPSTCVLFRSVRYGRSGNRVTQLRSAEALLSRCSGAAISDEMPVPPPAAPLRHLATQ